MHWNLTRMAPLAIAAIVTTASAHVALDAPNGGETLEAGTTFVVTWHVEIEHETENWDLWYSTTGPHGPWTELAMDLPAGDTTRGAVHTFDWIVPDAPSDTVRVRVRQDNVETDYEAVSGDDLAIVPAPCAEDVNVDGEVGIDDLLAILAAWGPCAGCPEDVDASGEVELADLLAVLLAWGAC